MEAAFDFSKPIAIGGDHAGFNYKEKLIVLLQAKGFAIKDFGAHSTESVDYPDYAHPVAGAVEQGHAACGILICGSGNGVAITANKHADIRAALCWQKELASLAREHNNANILCIPARFVTEELAEEMAAVFVDTPFAGGRHANRVEKIACG